MCSDDQRTRLSSVLYVLRKNYRLLSLFLLIDNGLVQSTEYTLMGEPVLYLFGLFLIKWTRTPAYFILWENDSKSVALNIDVSLLVSLKVNV